MSESKILFSNLRRVLKGALLFVPLLVLVMAVNVTVDPASLFQQGYEEEVARIVTDGSNAAELKNMDDRLYQQLCAQMLPQAPHTLVLGSSRSMQLTAKGLDCEGLFNAGVTNGDLRDMISIYLLYKSLDKLPQRVVLMTDYCMFNPGKLDARAYTEGYAAFARSTGTPEMKTPVYSNHKKWLQLFSLSYFQASLDYLEAGGGNKHPVPTTAYECDSDMRRSDGSYSYGLTFRGMTDEQKRENTATMPIHIEFYMGSYEPNSDTLRTQFEQFVALLQADGVEVVFLLPPIHPAMYQSMLNDDRFAAQVGLEDYFRAFAQAGGISTVGSYDAVRLGLTELDFYDMLHCSLEATNRYLADFAA